jgi:hypothetical protein
MMLIQTLFLFASNTIINNCGNIFEEHDSISQDTMIRFI